MEQKPNRFQRVPMRCQKPSVSAHNFNEVNFGYSESEAIAEAKRCLQCKNPLCVQGCPGRVKIPQFIKLIEEGKFAEAADKIKEDNPFPAVCGRVCPQELQCEFKCILEKKGAPIAIGHLERFAADWAREHGQDQPPKSPEKNGKKVAIIGAGPAGLTAAGELVHYGFDVTIYEASSVAGGILMYGIPAFRLPNSIVQHEVERLKSQGVQFELNVEIGQTLKVDDLLKNFDAVFIGCGVGSSVTLNIPGVNTHGVYSANDYLAQVNLMESSDDAPAIRGKKVLTIGAGNVAMDVSRVALRMGAEHSMIVYRRTETEMPARQEEVDHAKAEGVEFHLLSMPIEILSDEKHCVSGVKYRRVELGEADASGRQPLIPIENSEFVIECDVVITALGSQANPLIQHSTPDLDFSNTGTVIVKDDDGRTSKKFVYAAGDIVTGAETAILAIREAKRACRSIIDDLL